MSTTADPTIDQTWIPERNLPGHLGMRTRVAGGLPVQVALDVQPHHLAPNGYLHAGSIVSLADTACGVGCSRALPSGAVGFTTAELKTNFVATTTAGEIVAEAHPVHLGRTTQVWDALVTDADGRTLAVFRCTQVVLWPRD